MKQIDVVGRARKRSIQRNWKGEVIGAIGKGLILRLVRVPIGLLVLLWLVGILH